MLGRDGLNPVAFTCPAAAGSTLTFEFRESPDGSRPGAAIDPSHKGPCAVYMKQLSDGSSTAAGGGWFKIFESGYDNATGLWCTEALIRTNGLLSVALPPGLPDGAYLVRPELLALHEAQAGNPQFYVGCAQVYVRGGPSAGSVLQIPRGSEAIIPGHVRPGEPSVAFNIYTPRPRAFFYPMPGPPVFFPARSAGSAGSGTAGKAGKAGKAGTAAAAPRPKPPGVVFVPGACLITNANWCGVEVPRYASEAGCWDASEDCFRQEAACYAAAPPTGHANCDVWDRKCMGIQAACAAGNFVGPPNAGQPLQQQQAVVPGPMPAAQA